MLTQQIVRTWLYLIGTPERAQYLLDNGWQLYGWTHRGRCRGAVEYVPGSASQHHCHKCGAGLQFGQLWRESPRPGPEWLMFPQERERLYTSDRRFQDAFDAWDAGYVLPGDVLAWARWIQEGRYHGPAYRPKRKAQAA